MVKRVLFHFIVCGFLKFILLFILRKGEHEQGRGRETEREGERIPSRLCAVSTEPNAGLDPTNHEIMI